MKEIRISTSDVVTYDDLIKMINNHKEVYSYFSINDEIIMDKVTFNNIDKVGNFEFKISTTENNMEGYLMIYQEYSTYHSNHSGKWVFCHKIADEYNIRHGVYGNILDVDYEDKSDYPSIRHHVDNNKLNNTPSNIIRVSHKVHDMIHRNEIKSRETIFNKEEFISMDYYRKIARCSRHHEVREYGRLMHVAVKMKSEYNVTITEEFYNTHKYEYSLRPATWSRLISKFSDTDGINNAIDTYSDDKYLIYKKNTPNKIKIYLASGFFCDDDRSLVPFMETFLEARGYEVYSPSRDGIVLTPDATQEERMMTFKDNVDHIKNCDLMVACVNNKDTGTSVEIGMSVGLFEESKKNIKEVYDNDPDILSDKEKAILNQKCARIVTFSDNGTNLNVMILGAVLRHCGSWDELNNYLDYIDRVGIDYAERDIKSITDVKVY